MQETLREESISEELVQWARKNQVPKFMVAADSICRAPVPSYAMWSRCHCSAGVAVLDSLGFQIPLEKKS